MSDPRPRARLSFGRDRATVADRELRRRLVAALAITKATATWNDYVWPLVITTGKAHMTVQLALAMFESEYTVVWNNLMAATTLVVLPLVIVFFLFQRYFVQGIVTTGLK